MDDTTLEKLLQARQKVTPCEVRDKSLTDQVMAQLPAIDTVSSVVHPLPFLTAFAAMVAVAVAIGSLVAPEHQHDHHHAHQTAAPPAMNGFDSSALLVAR